MQIKCEYCGQFLKETDAVCPNCGAPNNAVQRSGSGVPKTIEELLAFCRAHKLPLEQMRFFIGQDYRGPRAFGIYQDEEGNFVVYKNKSDGSRAVRYKGRDEAYAVNEIYQKMKAEISNQRAHNVYTPPRYPSTPQRRTNKRRFPLFLVVILLVFGVNAITGLFTLMRGRMLGSLLDSGPSSGYYYYDDSYYYNQNGSWYCYDDLDWIPVTVAGELLDNYDDYYASYSYSGDYDIEDFQSSDYYVEPPSYDYDDSDSYSSWDDSDWDDSDWDWDSGSDWDSGWSDWDSDW